MTVLHRGIRDYNAHCCCGWDSDDWQRTAETRAEAHRAHVAAVVAESGWLADRRAETWIECLQAVSWALDHGPADQAIGYVLTNTPYRTTEDNTTDRT